MGKIRAIALDVDGVLTDGTFWWGPGGEEFKRFSFRDVMGVSMGRRAGLRFAIVSGEGGPLLDRIAAKLLVQDVFSHCKDKAAALRTYAEQQGLPLEEICFLGDDINDLAAMDLAGLSACPADAHPQVLAKAGRVLTQRGGHGALRELIDQLMEEGCP